MERGFPRIPSGVMDVGCYLDWPLSLFLGAGVSFHKAEPFSTK